MADHERSPSDSHAGLPEISPDDIAEFKKHPRDFATDFERLKKENPALAHELSTGVIGLDPRYLNERRAYVMGALSLYFLLDETLRVQRLGAEIDRLLSTDGDDGEDRPLSA